MRLRVVDCGEHKFLGEFHSGGIRKMVRNQSGQSTIEYVIVITAVIVVILAIAGNNGIFRKALDKTYQQSMNGMTDMSNRFYDTMKNF